MPTKNYFSTPIFSSQLPATTYKSLNSDIIHDAKVIQKLDKQGREWCKTNYIGGYTSYSSISDLHLRFGPFMDLKVLIDKQVKKFVSELEVDLMGRKVEMTTCWINVMPHYVHHSLHLHPLCFISGTYYVQTPPGSGSIKFEDPRLGLLMGSPPPKPNAKRRSQYFEMFEPKPGQLLLWESWLRHEVFANRGTGNRISVSFNYEWI